jgi:hypothetical protein
MIVDLKTDKKFPHHYLITVAIHPATVKKHAGEMFLKHGPLYFSNDDVERVRSALILSNDRLFKTSQKQALKNFNCSEIVSMVRGMDLARNVNLCSMHHFSSPVEIEGEWFANLVEMANKSEHNKELLQKSRVR